MYFKDDIPTVMKEHQGNSNESLCCYADESTLTVIDSDHTELYEKLTENYNILADYMINNILMLNEDKTHLVVMCSSQSRYRSQSASLVKIDTGSEFIKPTSTQKILGCHIQNDLKWTEHIRYSEDNLLKSLNSRINALKLISRLCDFKGRKTIANGIFLSKISYMITLWGSCSKELLNSLQVIQNRAARLVTKSHQYIHTGDILKQIGWLSVHQLVEYHHILQIYKVKKNKSPESLLSMFDWEYKYQTRQATEMKVKPIGTPRLKNSQNSFRWRASNAFNNLPTIITQISQEKEFKSQVKKWIMKNVPLKP